MEQLLKVVKPFGREGAHIILPKKLLGKTVRVEIQELEIIA
jgi:putative transposon-encoded protein